MAVGGAGRGGVSSLIETATNQLSSEDDRHRFHT